MKFPTKAVVAAILTLAAIIPFRPASAAALAPDSSFDAPLFTRPSPATRIVLLPDGKFLRYFNTDTLVEQRTGPMTRHFPDGSLDTSFRIGGDFGAVGAAAADSQGRVIVSVLQREYGGGTEKVLRLNADGSIDPSFKVSDVGSFGVFEVQALVSLPDGNTLVSGLFSAFGGARSAGILRLLPDGTRDPTFNATATGIGPAAPAVQPDGKIVIVGSFR
ncbi:MAG TPA: delta-60 repeat domain-containing protein, partial [Chthoniobacterales bacterium]|nr:delta-60 repeat domain-containing protein [Chthoniobacterales bacterium]